MTLKRFKNFVPFLLNAQGTSATCSQNLEVLHTFAEALAIDRLERQLFAEPYILKRLFNYSCHTTVYF
ncbi:hypothetical protein ACYBNJ_06410 [Klebsiella pneumoniae]|uniref:hypothetical protein n=1 Tax=Klebsiella pneumoniae TaxID=573 RepID=UPI001CBF3775|nr:hypothetical protein [Klebsiella pneumoniae]MBZ1621973.1 hypothetical protein [Klebsiella pneumoniae]